MIKIYTVPYCPHCQMAKKFFEMRRLVYEEFNVRKDEDAYEIMLAKSHQSGVPVIEIGNHIVVGFHKQMILRILEV